jgi:hypothetical protein
MVRGKPIFNCASREVAQSWRLCLQAGQMAVAVSQSRTISSPEADASVVPMPRGAGIAIATGTTKNTSNSWTMGCRVATRD